MTVRQPQDHHRTPLAGRVRLPARAPAPDSAFALASRAALIPLTVRLRLLSAWSGRVLVGYAVSMWDCSPATTRPAPEQRTTDEAGWVRFAGVFPEAYPGHWPHLHVEIRPAPGSAPEHTAELALPGDACTQAYGWAHGRLDDVSLATDTCFTSGWPLEIASVTGDPVRGLVATRTVGLRPGG
ncbi:MULTISPECIES: hypothetical protein [Actinoplanes]|uniref:hypothetical protein n=1 Tax=Actinoplanes TaxID=1865 RepID=UPI000695F828|nr:MULTISPECIES: hypothetical protein [Actinoplanes]GLY04619.1 hypothetical protein Acsp01_49980 [Actinoplanes sp. NBRC 101535]